ncbi:hypothetical protein [Actinomadura sp. J1-007]|uniref:hypothetical protein n=1 Tax=Actinomadura sp. J1-007 TaxID=2661913 RepID=UPI0019D62F3B|nr:hypothetical protein [Actinomadura sp. J1-007]
MRDQRRRRADAVDEDHRSGPGRHRRRDLPGHDRGGQRAERRRPRQAGRPRAAALPPGWQLVTLPNANVPNFQRRVLYCPGSKRVLGGGGEARGNGAVLVGSFPTDDGRGWIVLGRQIGYSDVGISAFAICAD